MRKYQNTSLCCRRLTSTFTSNTIQIPLSQDAASWMDSFMDGWMAPISIQSLAHMSNLAGCRS